MNEQSNCNPSRPTTDSLPGTVKLYQRHLFVCTGRVGWNSKVEQDGGFIQKLSEEMAPHLNQMPRKVKITACDEPNISQEDTAAGRFDILLFPDGIRYLGVGEKDISILIQDHLLGDTISDRIPHQHLSGWHVFVCVHAGRDERCGQCGPPVADRFKKEITVRNLAGEITLRRTSHVGGHAYAGNVLIYPGGDWYGYVSPDDVPLLIENHIVENKPVTGLWRGKMGHTPVQQAQLASQWQDDQQISS